MLNHKQKNEIDGLPQFYKNSAIHFSGKNNRIKIGPKVFVKDSKIKLYGDSSLELEEGCYLQGCTFIIRNAHVKFGRNRRLGTERRGNRNRQKTVVHLAAAGSSQGWQNYHGRLRPG